MVLCDTANLQTQRNTRPDSNRGRAFWTISIIAIGLIAAGGLGYCFRAYMVMLLPEQASRFMKSAPLTASFGLLVIIVMIVLAVFADLVAPFGEREIVADVWEPAGGEYLLGTDNLGRDMFSRLVYGAQDLRVGAAGTVFDIVRAPEVNHRIEVVGGVLEVECRELVQSFFRARRD